MEAWRGIKPESVSYSFKKCGISNRLDGTEDDILWEEIGEQSTELEEEMEENDIYDDSVTATEFERLFGDSDGDEDFEGF